MKRKIIWTLVSCLMVLSLVTASCETEDTRGTVTQEDKGQTVTVGGEEEEKEVEEEVIEVSTDDPQYGGTITLALPSDPDWNLFGLGKAAPHQLAFNRLWDGDWTLGPAGGYGANKVKWGESTNIPDLKIGHIAESWSIQYDNVANEVTTIFQIREGINFAIIPGSAASNIVGGREINADDVAWNLTQHNNNPEALNLQWFPQIQGIEAVKTGPNEVSITHPAAEHLGNIMRLADNMLMFAPELWDAYGVDVSNWENSVGTGSYYVTDYVISNMASMKRNPAYWMTDPIGPGMGNQLPYIENVKFIVMPDASTTQAALRTANVDMLSGLTPEQKDEMIRRNPELKSAARGSTYEAPLYMRTDQEPFNNVNFRRALMMATDFNTINDSLYQGLGDIVSWPYYYHEAYADLYFGLDDPEMTDSIRELYTYNPDKAKQLLADAGYPAGFKTSITGTQGAADYYSIIVDMWSKVGIEVEMNLVPDFGALIGVVASRSYEGLVVLFVSPVSTYPEQYQYSTPSWINASYIDDPYINDMAEQARVAALTDFRSAMKITKELRGYILDNAYCIPTPRYPFFNVWWPWLRNYTGETSVGYFPGSSWVQWIWIDQDLKKEMGY
ncbi:MAG: ABC transporter substrate-binding protein [Dehalococcoidales bacterium]|nr:MAG: ABC transporter substrate-binding protein [Dehalococcoidales bacterium]